MQVTSHGVTDIGLTRENNEDRFAIDSDLGMYIVCDGMGGHAGGEVAAAMALTSVTAYFRKCHASMSAVGSSRFARMATIAIRTASEEIHFLAAHDAKLKEMGTTLSMLALADDHAHIANVGDSRVYLVRDRKATLLTTDQTIRNELLARGYSADDPLANGRFSRMLTHSVGEGESVEVQTLSLAVEPGDRFLLCTDGLSKYFDGDQAVEQLVGCGRPAAVTRNLVNFAKRRGGSDNITVVVVAAEPEYTDGSTIKWRVSAAVKPTADASLVS